MIQTVEYRFGASLSSLHAVEWLFGNGYCYIASNTRAFSRTLGSKPITTLIQSPRSNGIAENLIENVKCGCLLLAIKPDSVTFMNELKTWFEHCNKKSSHFEKTFTEDIS